MKDEIAALRRAVTGLIALALLLPGILGALSTPELVHDRALHGALQVLCNGETGQKHEGAPASSFGCELCPVACAAGCALQPSATGEIGPLAAGRERFAVALLEALVSGIGPRDDGLPRGPPIAVI